MRVLLYFTKGGGGGIAMTFSINTRGIRQIDSYEEAKYRYDNIKPIRGNPNDIRPLGDRNKQHMRIVKGSCGDYYAAVLYRTECVQWHSDGRIVVNQGGWATDSTAAFVHAVSPFGCYKMSGHLWVVPHSNYPYVPLTHTPQVFKNIESKWCPENPPKPYVLTVNRKEAARIRKLPAVVVWMEFNAALDKLEGSTRGLSWDEIQGARCVIRELTGALDEMCWLFKQDPDNPDFHTVMGALRILRKSSSLSTIYTTAVNAGLTTNEALYTKKYVTVGRETSVRRGICV